jgi:SET domain-containing protein
MVFAWPANAENYRFAVVLGSGTVFNHSMEPNATWVSDEIKCCFRFYSLRDIKAGEEIFTNYNREGGNDFD